jgi:diguanylate cyclase (GGDEF)-like protein
MADGRAVRGFSGERTAARIAAFRLVLAVKKQLALDETVIDHLIERADRNRWYEVSFRARGAAWLAARQRGASVVGMTEKMRGLAEMSDDPAVRAAALAFHAAAALIVARDQGTTTPPAEAELVAAVVALEGGTGDPLERIGGHASCGLGFRCLELWELALEQYEAAVRIDPIAERPDLASYRADFAAIRTSILSDLVDLEISCACALHVAGDELGSAGHGASALRHVATLRAEGSWPAREMDELRVRTLVVQALTGVDVVDEASAVASNSDAACVGHAQLAMALSLSAREPATGGRGADRADGARDLAEAAIASLRGTDSFEPLLLAMDLAAKLEEAVAGQRVIAGRSTQLRLRGRSQADSMAALLGAERMKVRSAELERHAHIDDLTGLANRRGFHRYLTDLLVAEREQVSLLVVDVNRFKEVNDRQGHQAGDRVLQTVAWMLAGMVRATDLAARLGGDEFLLLLDGADLTAATDRAETIAEAATGLERAGDVTISLTIGVASGGPGELDRLLADADRVSSRGKPGRRRRVASPMI